MTKYLDLEQILILHENAIGAFGGTQGIQDQNLIESALSRPMTSAFGADAYPTLFAKAAALFHGVVHNHPFLDGNKRTAFGALHLMLLINSHDLTASSTMATKMCLDAIDKKWTVEDVSDWIKLHSKKIHLGRSPS